MPKTSVLLFALTIFLCLFALTIFLCLFAHSTANAQQMQSWTCEQVLEDDPGYPVSIGPSAGQTNYAELSNDGPVVYSSVNRAADNQATAASIAAHQVSFKVVWHLSGTGRIPTRFILQRAYAYAGISHGVSVKSFPTSEGADAAVNGPSQAYAETYGNATPYQTSHTGLDVFEDVTANNQVTCQTSIHTVAATAIAGNSYWAQGIYHWQTTN